MEKSGITLRRVLTIVIALIAIAVVSGYIIVKPEPTKPQNNVALYDENNGFKLSKAPGPLEQDLLAKPFDMSFRELIRKTEDAVSNEDQSNIFNFFSEEDLYNVYTENNLNIKDLKVKILDTGMFRNIEGTGKMSINNKIYQCLERVDLINSDVLVLNCEATNEEK